MQLQTRFILNLGLLTAVVMLLFSVLIRQGINQFNRAEIENRLVTHLQLSTEFFEQLIDTIKADLDIISQNTVTRLYLSADDTVRYQLFHNELVHTISRYQTHNSYYSEIAIILPDGYKDVFATKKNDYDINFEYDKTYSQLITDFIEIQDGIYFLISESNQDFMLSAYLPINKYSPLIKADDNPVIALVKISVNLKHLAESLSTPYALSSFKYNAAEVYSESMAQILEIEAPLANNPSYSHLASQTIYGLSIQSTLRNDFIFDKSRQLLWQSLFLVALAIVSLVLTSIVLLKVIILNPLKIFTKMIESSDIEEYQSSKVLKFKGAEILKLNNSFNLLMSRLQRSSKNLKLQAFTDTLTGLPNRAALYQFLKEVEQTPLPKRFSILFLDLDGFKQINDIYGHQVGDLLLCEVAKKLQQTVRGGANTVNPHLDSRQDSVIRLGGDEFTIILNEDSQADIVAERIIHLLQQGINIANQTLYTGVSIGISIFPDHTDNPELLIQYADLAMYHAKNNGKMRFSYFTPELSSSEHNKLMLEETIREGIELNRFDAHFQAKIDGTTGRIKGVEALARLTDAHGNMISPVEFIPMALNNGVLEYITYIVTEKTCQLLQTLNEPTLVASINIAPSQLNDLRLISDIRKIMWRYGITPSQIEFEVTEEELITHKLVAKNNLKLIRSFGFRTALDDFGAGYSSLGHLKNFQFDTLKLDRVFVNSDDYNTESSIAVIQSIRTLAETLNMEIVAEGLETEAQVDFMRMLGINLVQGYYYSRPLPMEEFCELYNANQTSLEKLNSLS